MPDVLNQYGDYFKPALGGYGVDIASQRQDELDLSSLAFIREKMVKQKIVQAVELGGGLGSHSIQMAMAGAHVTMIDVANTAEENFQKITESANLNIKFILKDFTQLTAEDILHGYDLLYSQRAIHYIPYEKAKEVLRQMFNYMKIGGAIFISAAGWDTEYGQTFPDRECHITKRFNFVTPEMQQKYNILHKIVTYTQEEMSLLLKEVGFSHIQVTTSSFGNIKAMAKKLSFSEVPIT